MDTSTIPEAKESKTRRRIIEDRLARKSAVLKNKAAAVINPLKNVLSDKAKSFYKKINTLEKEFREASVPKPSKIKSLLADGNNYLQLEDFVKAEDCFIEVIELNNKEVDAYLGLGELYLAQKDFQKAKESFAYALKILTKKSAKSSSEVGDSLIGDVLVKLGLVNQQLGDFTAAFDKFRRAVDLAPNNPKYLDLLLKNSIILKDKNTARDILAALKKADPDNQKLPELEEEVNEI